MLDTYDLLKKAHEITYILLAQAGALEYENDPLTYNLPSTSLLIIIKVHEQNSDQVRKTFL